MMYCFAFLWFVFCGLFVNLCKELAVRSLKNTSSTPTEGSDATPHTNKMFQDCMLLSFTIDDLLPIVLLVVFPVLELPRIDEKFTDGFY